VLQNKLIAFKIDSLGNKYK